jgi:hypothetical protein
VCCVRSWGLGGDVSCGGQLALDGAAEEFGKVDVLSGGTLKSRAVVLFVTAEAHQANSAAGALGGSFGECGGHGFVACCMTPYKDLISRASAFLMAPQNFLYTVET